MKCFESGARSLEYLLADELLALGCARATAALAGVNVEGSLLDAQRAVLWSRLASRVLWPLAEFPCEDEQALYRNAMELPWEEHLAPGMTLAIDAHVSGDGITHARFAAQRVKDAIVDSLRASTGTRPDVDLDAPDLRLSLVVRRGRGILSVDLGGGPLHRRGWRRGQGEAPLKETLAAAVLARGHWPAIHAGGGALLDPMCGSGTLLIEGAAIAADVAPGLLRHGDTLPSRWSGFDRDAWQSLREDASAASARAGMPCAMCSSAATSIRTRCAVRAKTPPPRASATPSASTSARWPRCRRRPPNAGWWSAIPRTTPVLLPTPRCIAPSATR